MQNSTLRVHVMLSRTRQLNLSQLKWCLRVTLRSPWVGDWREVCLFAYGWYWYHLTGVGYPHLPRLKIRQRNLRCYLRLQLSLRSGCGHTAVFKLHIAIFPVKSCNLYCWQNHRHIKDPNNNEQFCSKMTPLLAGAYRPSNLAWSFLLRLSAPETTLWQRRLG